MATILHLADIGKLDCHTADLEDWEFPERYVYFAPGMSDWISGLEGKLRVPGRNLTPKEQVEQLLYDFVIGRPMAYDVDRKKLEPHGNHVWELKTPDVRLFGWYVVKKCMVIVCGELKRNLTKNPAYKPFINQVVAFREGLDLDPPKFITGVTAHDVG